MPRRELFDLIGELKTETEKAILVFDGKKEAWLPKSQVEFEKNKDGTYTITGPEWLFVDKGFI